ncbi:unnamed protein product [Penicillium nalgiovense]|nr:unnamed protein product [Penicillium nalgiovense]
MGSKKVIRSDDPEYMNATAKYVSTLGRIIERVEITNLIIYSAEILTWARGAGSTHVLILYGGAGETHEFGLPSHF